MIFVLSGSLPGGGHRFDSTVQMWEGHERALCLYTDSVVRELQRRGYYEELRSPLEDSQLWQLPEAWAEQPEDMVPPWMGQERVHAAHRATLLAEDREWYAQMAWHETGRREVCVPRPVPVPGDTVLHADGRVALVVARREDCLELRLLSGDRLRVPRSEFSAGAWRRCVTTD